MKIVPQPGIQLESWAGQLPVAPLPAGPAPDYPTTTVRGGAGLPTAQGLSLQLALPLICSSTPIRMTWNS